MLASTSSSVGDGIGWYWMERMVMDGDRAQNFRSCSVLSAATLPYSQGDRYWRLSSLCCPVPLTKCDADAIQCNLEYSLASVQFNVITSQLLQRTDLVGWGGFSLCRGPWAYEY